MMLGEEGAPRCYKHGPRECRSSVPRWRAFATFRRTRSRYRRHFMEAVGKHTALVSMPRATCAACWSRRSGRTRPRLMDRILLGGSTRARDPQVDGRPFDRGHDPQRAPTDHVDRPRYLDGDHAAEVLATCQSGSADLCCASPPGHGSAGGAAGVEPVSRSSSPVTHDQGFNGGRRQDAANILNFMESSTETRSWRR